MRRVSFLTVSPGQLYHTSESIMGIHHSGQVRHIAVVLRVERILACRVKLVDLCLQLLIRVWVRQEQIREACECARGRVRPCNDGKHAIVDKLLHWGRSLVWKVFVVLFDGIRELVGW